MAAVLLDGPWGTTLWNLAIKNGAEKVPVWRYNIEHPEFVEEVARAYITAGSKMLYTNTFTASRPDVARQSSYSVEEVVKAGVTIVKKCTEGTEVKTVLSMGPLTELMEPYGDLEEEEAAEIYDEMMKPGVEAGADIILFETFLDLNMLAVCAKTAMKYGKPVFCTMAFEANGKTVFGVSPEQMIKELEPLGVAALGLNCGITPGEALPVLKTFRENTKLPLIFKPNAGKPSLKADGSTEAACDASAFAKDAARALPYADYIGACCGGSPEYIRELGKLICNELPDNGVFV